jgi:hypothetical protein
MDQYLIPLVERFPDGPNAKWAQEKIDEIETLNLDRKISTAIRFGRELKSDEERQLTDAVKLENSGDKESAIKQYRAIMTLLGEDTEHKYVTALAKRRLKQLENNLATPDELETKLSEKMKEAEEKLRLNQVADARAIWESIVSLYKDNQDLKEIIVTAQQRLEATAPPGTQETNAATEEPADKPRP